jgi:proline racemase
VFTGRISRRVKLGDVDAIVPQITGFANYVRAPTDPFPTGFTVADIRIRLASRRP